MYGTTEELASHVTLQTPYYHRPDFQFAMVSTYMSDGH